MLSRAFTGCTIKNGCSLNITMGVLGKICPNILETLILSWFDIFYINGLKRHQEVHKNWKRAMKVLKVNLKAKKWWTWKFYHFSSFLGPFGTNYCENSVFLSFNVVKAKKATIAARNTKLHSSASVNPELFFLTWYAIIILPKRPIWTLKLHISLLKAKSWPWRSKNFKNGWKNHVL